MKKFIPNFHVAKVSSLRGTARLNHNQAKMKYMYLYTLHTFHSREAETICHKKYCTSYLKFKLKIHHPTIHHPTL